MKISIIFLLTITLVIVQTTADVRRYDDEYQLQKYRSNNKSINEKPSVKKLTSENNTNNKNVKKGFGISAWGLIGIIIGAIVISTSGYYAFLFYPFLCKKERNYDMIELANV